MRWLYLALWLLLLLDLFVLSPSPHPDQGTWVVEALLGQWQGKNPATVALFNVMGLWPLLFAGRLVHELRARPIPAWPFVAGSMALGAFTLLPWFILRPAPPEPVAPGRWLAWLDHPLYRALLILGMVGMLGWGLLMGDLDAAWRSFQTEQLIHVMSWDFVVLALVMFSTVVRGVARS